MPQSSVMSATVIFVSGFFEKQILERLFERPFRNLRHTGFFLYYFFGALKFSNDLTFLPFFTIYYRCLKNANVVFSAVI